MNADDDPDDDDGDVQFYEPQPLALSDADGTLVILDHVEFAEEFGTNMVQYRNGEAWYLERGTRRWVKIEPIEPSKPRPLKSVQ